MKVIAFYLPQFHRVLENDLWWGEGYTEWTAVKNAERLYENHYQPHIPLNNNYYDLLKKDTMQWQSKLMKKYHVYGMCFYHYYFGEGRKILEKPAENLLEWKDIDMPFCFSWANETWARTWSNVSAKNSWNSLKENKNAQEEENGILLRQDYGEEEDWEKHFYYLLPFFEDNRYIKVKNRPIFIIHKPASISCITQMMEKWNQLAYINGMEGIYFIASNSDKAGFDAYLRQEANYSDEDRISQFVDYNELCEKIIKNALLTKKDCYLCGFPGYDDTPRRGKKGEIVENSTPDKFYSLMRKIFMISAYKNKEITFVNAWNEWGEGMYLEPDEKYGYEYLEALKRALVDHKKIDEEKMQHDLGKLLCENWNGLFAFEDNKRIKSEYYMKLYDRWLALKEKGKRLQSYFSKNGYKRIALYGIGRVGKHFITDLENSEIQIIYGIDMLGTQQLQTFPVYTPDECLPEADIIVVSVIYDFNNVYKKLRKKFTGPIISLQEIIDYVEILED